MTDFVADKQVLKRIIDDAKNEINEKEHNKYSKETAIERLKEKIIEEVKKDVD